MPSLENHITRILGEAREDLTAVEIAGRLNAEGGAYTEGEIATRADKMSNLSKRGEKYHRNPEDASQAAARIVRETTENR
jgi:hypothetical protein